MSAAPADRTPAPGPATTSGPSPSRPSAPGATAPGARPRPAAPAVPTDSAATALRPVSAARITGGLWHARRAVNAATSIPDGHDRLEEAGNLHNLRLAAGTAHGSYRNDLPFMDSDLHKWLEAAAWQLGDQDTDPDLADRLAAHVTEAALLLAEAQRPDGYLQSYYQVVHPDRRWLDLDWGHELYCAGHLVQAAVAHARTTGRTDLLDVARRCADHIDATFGAGEGRIDGVCGHPEIETALVELYRLTGERRHLDLARYFVDRRGHGLLPEGRFGSRYWQDHVPVRDADAVAGHAVRQLYLLAGAVDVYAETGDATLLTAAERLWAEMAATRTYLTGGIGAHHTDEAFGDPYELPSERAYTETCAAIASVMLSWRLLLATGRARYADHLERVLFNGFLSGVSLDGQSYVYVNPLQVRDGHRPGGGDHGAFRTRWFRCACCPPNVMRLLASLPHYLAAHDDHQLVLHQYATGSYTVDGIAARDHGHDHGGSCGPNVPNGPNGPDTGGPVTVEVATDYPWQGRIAVTVADTPDAAWALTLRIPGWAHGRWRATVVGEPVDAGAAREGWLRLDRRWRPGDTVLLDLDPAPRLTAPPARADALRGCVAIERGPLVYCVERVDQPAGTRLEDLRLDPARPLRDQPRPDLLGGVVAVRATGHLAPPAADRPGADDWWPYAPADAAPADAVAPAAGTDVPAGRPVEITAIPYHLWAHREEGPMRVWLPLPDRHATGTPAAGQAGQGR